MVCLGERLASWQVALSTVGCQGLQMEIKE